MYKVDVVYFADNEESFNDEPYKDIAQNYLGESVMVGYRKPLRNLSFEFNDGNYAISAYLEFRKIPTVGVVGFYETEFGDFDDYETTEYAHQFMTDEYRDLMEDTNGSE